MQLRCPDIKSTIICMEKISQVVKVEFVFVQELLTFYLRESIIPLVKGVTVRMQKRNSGEDNLRGIKAGIILLARASVF